ncbi:hypothetical protein GJ496_009132 [Pomphorhynchus laevis]|nr:hypothetical protein GJ496_009132 [Pomphorhynchus laevis]
MCVLLLGLVVVAFAVKHIFFKPRNTELSTEEEPRIIINNRNREGLTGLIELPMENQFNLSSPLYNTEQQ